MLEFVGTEAWQKGASEDRLAHLFGLLEADTGVPRDCLPAAMDDRVCWKKRAMRWGGEGRGGGGGARCGCGSGRGSTEVDLVVVLSFTES